MATSIGRRWVEIMKTIAQKVINANKLCDVRTGTVTSESPLKIQIWNGVEIDESLIILNRNVTDFLIDMSTYEDDSEAPHKVEVTHLEPTTTPNIVVTGQATVVSQTATTTLQDTTNSGQSQNEHIHEYKGRKQWMVHNALKEGEVVTMIKFTGNVKYLVLDRVGVIQNGDSN